MEKASQQSLRKRIAAKRYEQTQATTKNNGFPGSDFYPFLNSSMSTAHFLVNRGLVEAYE